MTVSTNILTPHFSVDAPVLAAAREIRLVLFDVDGVLTDARLIIGDDGQEYKAFNSKDGHGLKMLQRNGVAAGIITGRTSKVVEHRVHDLGIKHVYQGCKEKLPVYDKLIHELKLDPAQTAFVGDDVVDLPIMLKVGLAIAVQDAHPMVKRHAHWITPSAGGEGAGREVCEMLMHAQGTYTAEMLRYLNSAPPA
jgi:3-deoxy-D-manno-octulosonate 8-phosphate phosphatase (KDO 8-P phosphatase)